MKLNPNFITQEIDDTQFLVPLGSEKFHGIVKNNKTAAFIINCLQEETSQEAILDAMEKQYDAPRDVLEADLNKALDTLRSIGAIEE